MDRNTKTDNINNNQNLPKLKSAKNISDNLKDTDNYKCLKPDFIISYSEQIKPKILNEAQRLGIPVVIVNNRSLESLDSEWLVNEKYNTYYANPEFDKSVNFVLR